MAGILIALQANNARKTRLACEREARYLQNRMAESDTFRVTGVVAPARACP